MLLSGLEPPPDMTTKACGYGPPAFAGGDDVRGTSSAACNTVEAFFGAIQKASGRSNRKFARTASAALQIKSAPATPATVTTSEIAPMSGIRPAFKSSVRVEAIGRKKAR